MITEESFSLPAEAESANTSLTARQLWESLNTSQEYRKAFVEEVITSRITAQIHDLRIKNGWDYKQFAERLGKKLSWAYRLENPTEAPPTIPTLLEVAATYDVVLDVRLRSFSELIRDVTTLGATSFAVPSFDEEFSAQIPELEHALAGNSLTSLGGVAAPNPTIHADFEFQETAGVRPETFNSPLAGKPPISTGQLINIKTGRNRRGRGNKSNKATRTTAARDHSQRGLREPIREQRSFRNDAMGPATDIRAGRFSGQTDRAAYGN
jgi:transcriptional regulator with XRE-family HTH domain